MCLPWKSGRVEQSTGGRSTKKRTISGNRQYQDGWNDICTKSYTEMDKRNVFPWTLIFCFFLQILYHLNMNQNPINKVVIIPKLKSNFHPHCLKWHLPFLVHCDHLWRLETGDFVYSLDRVCLTVIVGPLEGLWAPSHRIRALDLCKKSVEWVGGGYTPLLKR